MKMKRLFVLGLAVMFMFCAANAFAWGGGVLFIGADANGSGGEIDGQLIPNGGAIGLAGGIGEAEAGAAGFVINGAIEGEVSALGGGAGGTSTYVFHPCIGDVSIGVRSYSTAVAATGAKVKVKVDPDRRGFGIVGGEASGFAAQGTLNASYVEESPIFFESKGFSGGIAAQGSLGGFEGEVYAISFGDMGRRRPIDSKAGGGFGAEIIMDGGSYSESYRYVNWHCNSKTEGMGTNVGAWTNVDSKGWDYDWDRGWADSDADVDGGWVAAGGAATLTKQQAPNDAGSATAYAAGGYFGMGNLGCDFNGSAIGYSATSVTTFNNMTGSVNSASAGMSVNAQSSSSHGHNGEPQ